MRKVSVFLVILLAAGVFSCKQYTANIEEFLSYWSAEASVVKADIQAELPVPTDKDGYPSVSSDKYVEIILKVKNPKNYQFLLPTASDRRSAFGFQSGVKSSSGAAAPDPGTDYKVSRIDDNTLKLVYTKKFLQAHEHGAYNLNPQIVLWSKEGRSFNESFTFNIRANTPPPTLEYRAIGKTQGTDGKQYYVLCLEVKDMENPLGTGLLHNDIAALSITAAGANNTVPLTVNGSGGGFDISKSNGILLPAESVSKLAAGETDSGTPDEIPAGSWIIYVKTGAEVKGGTQEYTFKLIDKKGLSSAERKVNTATNKLPPVRLYHNNTEIRTEAQSAAYPIHIGSSGGAVSLEARAKAGAQISGTVERKSGNGWSSVDTVSGTTAAAVSLPALGSNEHQAVYKIILKTSGAGYAGSDDTIFYVTLTQDILVSFSVAGGQGSLKGVYGATERAASTGSPAALRVPYGGTVTFTAVPDEGYEVESWSENGSPVNGTISTYQLDSITESKTVAVTFIKKIYTVTFSVEGTPAKGSLSGEYKGDRQTASGSSPATLTVPHSGTIVFTAVPAEGYKPVWSGVRVQAENPNQAELTVTQAASVSVSFVPESDYTITYHLNGGTDNGSNPASYNTETATIMLQSAVRKGYDFAGWYANEGLTGSPVTQIVQGSTGNKVFWAKWEPKTDTQYKVEHHQQKSNSTGYTIVSGDTEHLTGATGAVISVTHKTYPGFEFDRQESSSATIAANGSTVVKVYYKRKTVNLTFNLNGGNVGGSTSAVTRSGKFGTAFTAPDPVKTGYTFSGWNPALPSPQVFPAVDAAYTAQWTANTYPVTFSVEGGQGGSLKGVYNGTEQTASGSNSARLTVPYGEGVTFTAVPDEGYEMESWTSVTPDTVPADKTKATLANITQATTVRVKFKKIELSVLKIKQNFDSDEEKNISAAAKGYVSEDIISDATQYTEANPLVIYNINGKARLSLTAPAGAAASYTLDDVHSSNTAEIMLPTAKKYKLEVWTQKSGLQSDKAVLYVEVKNGLGSYIELQNTVKNAPGVTGGITITINTNSLDCSAEPSEITVTDGKKLIIQSSVSGQARTINANQKGRIFKISGAGTELTLKDIKLENGKAADGKGGSVYLESGSFIMQGASYIVPGTNGKNDVYLADGTTLTVDGNLTLPAAANSIAALISTNETNAPSGYTADGTKQVLSLINGAAQADCSLFKLARATGASVTGEAASGYISIKYGIQCKSGSPAKGVITETGSSGSVSPYEPSPYAFVLIPSITPISFTQGGTNNTITFTLKKKPSAPGGQAQLLDSGTQFKLKMELYQSGTSLAGLGENKGVKTGGQNENGIGITLPSYLPAGTYQLYLRAEVNGQSYDGWQGIKIN